MYALNENGVPVSRSRIERILIYLPYVYRYARAVATVHFVVGTWLVILGLILCSYGYFWGAALLLATVLHYWLGYRLMLAAQAQTEQGWNRRNYRAHRHTAPTAQTAPTAELTHV
jgi:hypothetical protein